MSQLHLIQEEDVTESFALNKGEMLVGREEYCDIRLPYDGVSRKHMKLLTVMDDTFLEDMASKNGTFVNGKLLKKAALNDGDIIQIGQVELRFEKDSAERVFDEPMDPDATSVLQPGDFGPNSLAARNSGKQAEGISPVTERVERIEQASAEAKVAPVNESAPGFWGKLKKRFGGT